MNFVDESNDETHISKKKRLESDFLSVWLHSGVARIVVAVFAFELLVAAALLLLTTSLLGFGGSAKEISSSKANIKLSSESLLLMVSKQ